MKLRGIVLAAMLVAMAGAVPARANQDCSTAGGSAEAPHLTDGSGDWNGGTGTGTGLVPAGDVWREGADVLAAWIAKDPAPNGKYQAHIQIANLQNLEANEVINFLWDWAGTTPEQTRRYVSATISGRGGVSYRYGYVGRNATTGTGEINEVGSTSGKIVVGAPGEMIVDLPLNRMGSPTVGASLENPMAETRLLAGASGAGLLYVADDTSDGDGCLAITLS